MILNNIEEIDISNYPIIIIGSGPAGLSLALSLEKKNIKSIIIEAGDIEYSEKSQTYYAGKITGDIEEDFSSNRLRQFGGTSGHWGGWCCPLEEYDLKQWPIKKKDLNIYLNDACSVLEIDHEFNKAKINEDFNQVEFKFSKVKFNEKYYNHVTKTKNIILLLNSQFLYFKGTNKLIKSGVILSNKKQKEIFSKFFILASGGVENSRLLLWSRENNNGLFNKDLPIGNYWMIHPWLIGGSGLISKKKIANRIQDLENEDLLFFGTSENLKNKNNDLGGLLYMRPFEDVKLYKKFINDILCIAPVYGKKITRLIANKDLKCGNIFLHMEDKKEFNNKIYLSNQKDEFGIPKYILNYKFSDAVLNSAKYIMESFATTCVKNDYGRISIVEDIINLKKIRNLGANHHMGGTIIGDDYKRSVVDSNLNVHGIKNLFITGSSVFKTTGHANPTLTIVQLSLRLSEYIKNKINV
jgi:hypothetical protein